MDNTQEPAANPALFKKGDKVILDRGDMHNPTEHVVVSGPHAAANCEQAYVISNVPGWIPAHVLSKGDTEGSTAPESEPTPLVQHEE